MTVDLILLPGTLADERLFEAQRRALAPICRPDVMPLPPVGTIQEMAAAVLESAPERFAIAGLSLGGIVAMEIARTARERVVGLGLLDTNHRAATRDQRVMWNRFASTVSDGGFDEIVDELLPSLSSRASEPAIRRLIREMAAAIGPEVFLLQNAAQDTRRDNRVAMAALTVPALVLCGSEDAICPAAIHEELATLLPNGELIVVEGAGHLSTVDRPRQVSSAMTAWIRRVEQHHTITGFEVATPRMERHAAGFVSGAT